MKKRNFKINERQGELIILALEALINEINETPNPQTYHAVIARDAITLRNTLTTYEWTIDQ